MTDFIHEQQAEERSAVPSAPPADEAPLDEQTGQKRVYIYIFILFIVAFCLLLWSFLMNQRSNDQVISELRGSANTLQSTLDRNIELEQRTEELEKQCRELEAAADALEEKNQALEADRDALRKERDELQTALAQALAERDALKASLAAAEPAEGEGETN